MNRPELPDGPPSFSVKKYIKFLDVEEVNVTGCSCACSILIFLEHDHRSMVSRLRDQIRVAYNSRYGSKTEMKQDHVLGVKAGEVLVTKW